MFIKRALSNSHTHWFPFAAVLLVLSFQNCSPFTPISHENELSKGEQNGLHLEVIRVYASELDPIQIDFQGDGLSDFAIEETSSFHFDVASRSYRWLPKQGEAGVYEFSVSYRDPNLGRVVQPVVLTVDPLTDDILYKGPPRAYLPRDVGHVFVHGKGDIDHCLTGETLVEYWGGAEKVIAPERAYRNITCYDGRRSVTEVAIKVAEQILSANCGGFDRCIVTAHSMGGLILNHILTHDRLPQASDIEPELFAHWELYRAAKDRVLFVIALGSAAGGSKLADIVENPNSYTLAQAAMGFISRWFGLANGATQSLRIDYASHVLAPMTRDPGVPFFMVAGYSDQIIRSTEALYNDYLNSSSARRGYFNGEEELALVDYMAQFSSRSDGAVSFRSACGVASANAYDGPGHREPLADQLDYCFSASKKPSHYAWFATNLNHILLQTNFAGCQTSGFMCKTVSPQTVRGGVQARLELDGRSAVDIIRRQLVTDSAPAARVYIEIGPQPQLAQAL